MKAVITVTGKDCVGIIADVSAVCAKAGANIIVAGSAVFKAEDPSAVVAKMKNA